jgi:hypothetical protein
MTDWNSFLRSDEFRQYRKKQIQAVAHNIKKSAFQIISNGKIDLVILQGKLEMINILLRLPESLTKDDKLREQLKIQLDEDVSNLTKYLMRESLRD